MTDLFELPFASSLLFYVEDFELTGKYAPNMRKLVPFLLLYQFSFDFDKIVNHHLSLIFELVPPRHILQYVVALLELYSVPLQSSFFLPLLLFPSHEYEPLLLCLIPQADLVLITKDEGPVHPRFLSLALIVQLF